MFTHTRAFGSFSVNDLPAAKRFYQDVLELNVADNAMGLLELHFDAGYHIVVYPKQYHVPATFTVLNFPVADIEDAVEKLQAKGITFEQYGGEVKTDEKGISRSAQGPAIAWFRDPAGNILSVMEQS